jgi:hypothetical protein
LIDDAVSFFTQVRERGTAKRKISPAELIDWLTFILSRNGKVNQGLREAKPQAVSALGALAKDPRDREPLQKELDAFLG